LSKNKALNCNKFLNFKILKTQKSTEVSLTKHFSLLEVPLLIKSCSVHWDWNKNSKPNTDRNKYW